MGTPYKRFGRARRAMNYIFEDYSKRSQLLYLEYALECFDGSLEHPTWRPLGAEPTRDVIVAEKARRDYQEALKGYDVQVRIVARYVNPEPFVMVGWPRVKQYCEVCENQITVGPDLRLVSHGRLVSHIVDPLSGKVRRTSHPCPGSGTEV